MNKTIPSKLTPSKLDHGSPFHPDTGLHTELARFGARDMDACMQCGNCSASCPLSEGHEPFPRQIYRYLQLGLRERLLASPVPWLCYYCGECNTDCPRGAEPAETMMAARRWLTAQYDWTGLAKKLYLSEKWEIGALSGVALFIVLLFVFFHGPVITDRVAVNTFAPVLWIEIGDLVMAAVLSAFLLSNAFRMYWFIMAGTRVPPGLYFLEAKSFILHFATQKRWRKCSEDKTRWLKHFLLVTGYMTMMTLIIGCIRWFQVDDTSWHFTSIFGYYATAVLLYLTVDMFFSRLKKKETIHRFSEPTDWLFLVLLFFTTLSGILMHIVRMAGWPMGTYVMYVIHLAIAVPMLVIEVPFGKWSHLFYRPLAIFLTRVRERAFEKSRVDSHTVKAAVGDTFLGCLQCGTCSGLCPVNRAGEFSPRSLLRQISLDTGTVQTLDQAVWQCVTCHACNTFCPAGIDIIDVAGTVRNLTAASGRMPEYGRMPLLSLSQHHNPWGKPRDSRMDWGRGLDIPAFDAGLEYNLFTCCTTAYGINGARPETGTEAARALPAILARAKVSFGTLESEERCCGDPAYRLGDADYFNEAREANTRLFLEKGIKKILATSPHCYTSFKKYYPGLTGHVEIVHYTQLLDRLIRSGKITPNAGPDLVVTYHDPCYLGRHNSVFEPPRRILKAIPGLTIVEMPHNRENSLCCGGGGGHAWRTDGTGLASTRVREALATGAQVMATACPFCTCILDRSVRETGLAGRLKVMDLSEILNQSLASGMDEPNAQRGYRPQYQEVGHD